MQDRTLAAVTHACDRYAPQPLCITDLSFTVGARASSESRAGGGSGGGGRGAGRGTGGGTGNADASEAPAARMRALFFGCGIALQVVS